MRAPPFKEDELRTAVDAALCWNDVLRALGRRTAGGNYQTVQKYVRLLGISTDHFDPAARTYRSGLSQRRPIEEVLIEGSSFARGHLKERLFREGFKDRRCELCGQGEEWRGKRMSLILDHINGVSDDNRLENLQIVCPNCAATLDTHCNRNTARREPRICLTCSGEFQPAYSQQRYCSPPCAAQGNGARAQGVARPEARKVERPPYDQLKEELAATNFSAVGRKYGVSGNAVRKWVRAYEAAQV